MRIDEILLAKSFFPQNLIQQKFSLFQFEIRVLISSQNQKYFTSNSFLGVNKLKITGYTF